MQVSAVTSFIPHDGAKHAGVERSARLPLKCYKVRYRCHISWFKNAVLVLTIIVVCRSLYSRGDRACPRGGPVEEKQHLDNVPLTFTLWGKSAIQHTRLKSGSKSLSNFWAKTFGWIVLKGDEKSTVWVPVLWRCKVNPASSTLLLAREL